MASTVLPNGIIIPEKFSRDWYADLYHNWQELDNLLGVSPGDGTLTIQKNGTTVGTFSANQATNETINIEVPDVNDATLTIQKNGTTVDTFTANSSTDKTVDITVPTKTSDLTNDSGFITSDNTKIPLAGSNAISGDLVPSTDGTVNLGSVSYQWNQAYIKSLTINGVACGDILTHNASEFVDVTGNQTISGNKTFSNGLFASKSRQGDLATLEDSSINSTNEDANGMPLVGHTNSVKIKGSQSNVVPCMLTGQVFTSGNTSAELRVYKYKDISRVAAFNIYYTYSNDTAQAQFVNCNIGTNADGLYNIGSSVRRFNTAYVKAINNLNPGALSLPSINNTGANAWIAIDTTDWVKSPATSTAQKYMPPADGWLNVRVDNASMLGLALTDDGNYMHQMVRSETPSGLALLLPVFKDKEVAILVGGNENLAYNRVTFYPCQGNV